VEEEEITDLASNKAKYRAFMREFDLMKRKAFKVDFRIKDNKAQKKKGQPSLDSEDTGTQWKNDKF
jgi:hypothetical protein